MQHGYLIYWVNVKKRMDMSDYSIEALRTPGHLAERLLSIFYFHVKRTRNLKIKTLQTVVFFNTDPVVHLKPAYAENNNAVVLSANEYMFRIWQQYWSQYVRILMMIRITILLLCTEIFRWEVRID